MPACVGAEIRGIIEYLIRRTKSCGDETAFRHARKVTMGVYANRRQSTSQIEGCLTKAVSATTKMLIWRLANIAQEVNKVVGLGTSDWDLSSCWPTKTSCAPIVDCHDS